MEDVQAVASAKDEQYVINVSKLTKSFGRKVVINGLDMQVRKGEIFGFLGPNGSGKTTFIRMLCGLLRPDSGSGTCLGYDLLADAWKIKPHVGYMAQKFGLYTDLTVSENLEFIARAYRIPDRKRVVAEAIEYMGLTRYEHHLAGTLSGGWKQRLALTGCTLHRPKLLLLDEPTAGVDPSARRDFWDAVHNLAAQGVTALISTHYMDEAERCHRLAYIAYGDLLASGTVDELVDGSGLKTWSLKGEQLNRVAERLRSMEGVGQVVAFGNTLHISGRDNSQLAAALDAVTDSTHQYESCETTLEEVFIDLMRNVSS